MGADIVEENIEKAIRETRKRAENPDSLFLDPLSIFMGREWLIKRGTSLTFKDLRAMARNPIINAIIQTRLNQMALFCWPQKDIFSPGFVVVSDDEEANQDEDRKKKVKDFIFHAGFPGHGEPNLEMWMRKFMRDSLIMDQACAEIVPRFNGKPAYVQPIDSGTVRLLRDAPQLHIPTKTPKYVQILHEKIHATFSDDELIFAIRNPNTDIDLHGYGTSELEILLVTITAIFNTQKFNASLVAAGGTNKGIFVIQGDAAKQQVDSFKVDLREAIRNAANYWQTPVIQVKEGADVKFLNIDKSNRDIEYAQLFDFLIKQSAAVYNIHPEELGWSIKATGTKTSFNDGQMNQINHSLEKGLRPLLKFFADVINRCVIARIDPKYRIEFRGINGDKERDVKNIVNEVTNIKTLNEVRAEYYNLPPLEFGDIPLNQNYIFHAARQTADTVDTTIDTSVVDDDLSLNPNDPGKVFDNTNKPGNQTGEVRKDDKQREATDATLARNTRGDTDPG